MCGIVGYIGKKDAAPIIYQNLKRLEYRGYDSYGIATLDGKIYVEKDVGWIENAQKKQEFENLPGSLGIGHTRWATHGKVNKKNAHPHLDCNRRIALVHNGIISNYLELKEDLINKGHVFESDTDTECVVHLIEENYNYKGNLEEAVRTSLRKIEGTYALSILSIHEPNKLICARKESPIILGVGNKEMFIGSDVASFLKFTKKAVALDDGEYAILAEDGYVVKDLKSGNVVDKETLTIEWSDEMAKKEGYAHFMLKEIFEQPQAITNALNVYPQDIQKLAELINRAERVYLIAAGTSLHAVLIAEYWFSQLSDKLVIGVDASELINKGVIDNNTLVIGVTQSGETYDTLAGMRYAKNRGAKTAAIVNVIGSTATRLADHVVLQGSGIEISVCATKTFTSQLIILLRTAIELAKLRGKDIEVKGIEEEILNCPSYVKRSLQLQDEIKSIAEKYCKVKNYIYIGKGINLPSALEGALKLKEITYNHAEGMSGGLLKHGTISLIDGDMHTIAIIPAKGDNRARIISNIQEVKARGGFLIGISSGKPVLQCDVNIVAPECSEEISPIVFAPIYQLLAYHTAVNLGREIDKPRALAKSVTVE